VILKRELVAFVDMQDLAYIVARLCPNQFIAPGLFDPLNDLLCHPYYLLVFDAIGDNE
jgi:hypothetical protein